MSAAAEGQCPCTGTNTVTVSYTHLDVYKRQGYTCVKPQGAFYLFMKALGDDAYAFCERAKKYDLLLVPSDDFGCPGYVRISYCVAEKTIVDSMPAFEKLMEEYRTNAV